MRFEINGRQNQSRFDWERSADAALSSDNGYPQPAERPSTPLTATVQACFGSSFCLDAKAR
jgi:hypothetical protein